MRVDSNNFVSNVAAKFGSEVSEQGKAGRAAEAGVAENGGSQAATAKAQGGEASGDDVVHFNSRAHDTAVQIEILKALALSQPEIRDGKIRLLQTAIGNGEYSVTPNQIAGALKSELGTDVYG